ncbi:sigma-54-dependent Fis family transcriptional regulator [bacterium SCSIO 12643]|nr:sigma-54-dependent Fis family transcriptional regulator [bacterium SCSIO 12643]
MNEFKIFIVEDSPWYAEMLKYHLTLNPDYEVHIFETGKDCLANMHLRPDVICLDYFLPDSSGEKLFEKIQSQNKDLPVIIISGQEELSVAVKLLKNGVYDYIIKDDHTKDVLWNSLIHLRENSNLRKEVTELKSQLKSKYDFQKIIIGQSPQIKKTFALIENASRTNINIAITGETGTGKEVVAKAIHYASDRSKKPFVAINMAAIPKELIESELFGHEKGAFTGALARKRGKFEEANGGTIFLDEIAEMDLNMQVKLLRVLQEREVIRVGGNNKIKFDAHLITATHKNLKEEVKNGTFRKDLFYRIMGLSIELPPLRQRGNDILILAKHFIDLFSKENKLKAPSLTPESKEKLLKYHFPGNVRELKSVMELACVMAIDGEIHPDNITFHADMHDDDTYLNVEKTLKEYNADIITYFLKKYNNNVIEVANILDIGKSTIYNLIKAGAVKNK